MSIEQTIQELTNAINSLKNTIADLKPVNTPIVEVKQIQSRKNKSKIEEVSEVEAILPLNSTTTLYVGQGYNFVPAEANDTIKELEQSLKIPAESSIKEEKAVEQSQEQTQFEQADNIEEEQYRAKVKSLAFKRMQEGIERIEIKKLIINLGCEQIADISGKNLEMFEKQLLELKVK